MLDVRDERVTRLVDERVEVTQIASGGYAPSEGPIWIASGGYLLFSDVRGSRRLRWDAEGGAREIDLDTSCGNGMTLDLEGRLIVCGGGNGEIVRMGADGAATDAEVLVGDVGGRSLNSPNDVIVASDGAIWFTDPWWAHLVGVDREPELDVRGVYRLAPDGALTLVTGACESPDGLCLSADESLLYIADHARDHIRAFEVSSDGTVGDDWLLAEDVVSATVPGKVDGVKCDEAGNVWTTGPHGLWVFAPDGTHLGIVRVPEAAQNFHWGGDDWRSVFVTATTSVYRFEAKIAGRREPFMR